MMLGTYQSSEHKEYAGQHPDLYGSHACNKKVISKHRCEVTSPSALGVLVVMLLKMLTRTRKSVMRRAIRPGMTSGGTTKLIQDTTTNRPEQQVCFIHLT